MHMTLKSLALPQKLEQALAATQWEHRDVLVGCLRDRHQLSISLRHRFYHMPIGRLEGSAEDVRYIAIYQSQTLFGTKGGIRYFGKVKSCETVERRQITQIPRDSDELYYRFSVERWQKLRKRVVSKELPFTHIRTTQFLLHNSTEIPELFLENERQFRLYRGLKKLFGRGLRKNSAGYRFEDSALALKDGDLCILQNGVWQPSYMLENYLDSPYTVFCHVLEQLPQPEQP